MLSKTARRTFTLHHLLQRHYAAAQPAINEVAPEVLAKARTMAPPVGLLAGIFGSIVGVGGGVVIVPVIVSACKNIPQRLVSGTSLAAVLSTALASAATFSSSGCVDIGAAAVISPVAMLTAPIGARLTTKLNCTALRRTLGYFLLCVAPLVPLKSYLLQEDGKEEENSSSQSSKPEDPKNEFLEISLDSLKKQIEALGPEKTAILAVTGGVAGLASGLLGIGGGTIVTPLLAICLPYGQATVLGTSLAAMVPPSAAALLQHNRLGNVDWRMAGGLALGTAFGGVLGSSAAIQAPPGVLEGCFAVGMAFLGRKTLQSIPK